MNTPHRSGTGMIDLFLATIVVCGLSCLLAYAVHKVNNRVEEARAYRQILTESQVKK
jgi:hypothetical protein